MPPTSLPPKPTSAPITANLAQLLLAWYGSHGRDLPWRAQSGVAADPYRVWLSEIMLQQTSVATVRRRFADFTARWPDLASLAAAPQADIMAAWAGLGYYARARNLIACAQELVAHHGGQFPASEAELRRLPGIGDYTAAAIAAFAFGHHAVVVDANVERVVARLFAIAAPLPGARAQIRTHMAQITPAQGAGDFAQAMMDLANGVCTPRAPGCGACPLRTACRAALSGRAGAFPVKLPKKARPQRFGTAFWLEDKGRVLLVRRPPRGLLGGMRALPTGPWQDTPPGLANAPREGADWRLTGDVVTHVFTHFRLELALAVGRANGHVEQNDGEWWPVAALDSAGLPTLFAKIESIGRAR
ncbi:MAG: A/G-specific adenine glycosylase [Sphingomonas sp.]|jgi:A/G-specific adenine glycosylase